MSRGEFGGHRGPSYGAISSPVGYDQEEHHQTEFQNLSEPVKSNIFQINSNTSSLERILKQISSGKDNVPHEKIHRIQQGTNKLASQTTALLKNMSSLCGSSRPLRIQHERLKEDFRESISRYYSVQNKIAEQEKIIVQTMVPKSRHDHAGADSDTTALVENEGRRDEEQQLSEQIEVDEATMYEREDMIRQIEADILDINGIFRDLATMVYEQGDIVDSIEGNIESANSHVVDANVQLKKASKYQKAARKKTCCLLVIVVLIAGALALIIYLSVKH